MNSEKVSAPDPLQKTFSLNQIKQAFYERFHESGTVDFPGMKWLDDELPSRVTNAQWEMFLDSLLGLGVDRMQMKYSTENAPVFVFGSNEAGIHGSGAALDARRHRGAVYGKGFGHFGNSFAIPTKDLHIKTLPLENIKNYVNLFIDYANAHPELRFEVTRIGCGLAGYTDADIAPMFAGTPENCELPEGWREWKT